MTLQLGYYATVAADLPWQFKNRSVKGEAKNPNRHYPCSSTADLCGWDIPKYAARDCTLLLWATDPMLPDALGVMAAWGFTYKTVAFTWVKTNADGSYFMGPGYWTRANPEQCLLGVRGNPPRLNTDVRRLIVAPRREHSRKPEEFFDRTQRLVGGPYLEVCARQRRPGWDAIGNELDKFASTVDPLS